MKNKNDFQLLRKKVDSNEEVYFIWWMEELYLAGYILKYSRAKTYELATPEKRPILKKMKTKTKQVEEHVFHGVNYTPDFVIQWSQTAVNVFVTPMEGSAKKGTIMYCDHELKSIVEIKGTHDRNREIPLYTIKIKWLYQKGIYVHLFKLPKLFQDTFTPRRYLRQNILSGQRSLKWKTRSLTEYVNIKKSEWKNTDTVLELFRQ